MINTFDCDGVLDFEGVPGIYPGPSDVIITGRSYEEYRETERMLRSRGILNKVFYNPLPFNAKTRISSGQHKANIITGLIAMGIDIGMHFEDDPVQISEIKKVHPHLKIVHVSSDLVDLENKKRD